MSPRKNGPFRLLSIAVWKKWDFISDWIRTGDLARHSRNPYTPYHLMKNFWKFLRQILNGRFILKRQKTRIIKKILSRSNFCMKFSELYEKVHNLPDFGRIPHEKVIHLKSDVNYSLSSTWMLQTFVHNVSSHLYPTMQTLTPQINYRKIRNKSRGLYFFLAIFSATYIRERLIDESGLYWADFYSMCKTN